MPTGYADFLQSPSSKCHCAAPLSKSGVISVSSGFADLGKLPGLKCPQPAPVSHAPKDTHIHTNSSSTTTQIKIIKTSKGSISPSCSRELWAHFSVSAIVSHSHPLINVGRATLSWVQIFPHKLHQTQHKTCGTPVDALPSKAVFSPAFIWAVTCHI